MKIIITSSHWLIISSGFIDVMFCTHWLLLYEHFQGTQKYFRHTKENTAVKYHKYISPSFFYLFFVLSLLLHLTGDWTPPGVQSKFHTWSGLGNQLENPSSIFTPRLRSISSLSSGSHPLLTRTSSFLSWYLFFFSQHHFQLLIIHVCAHVRTLDPL